MNNPPVLMCLAMTSSRARRVSFSIQPSYACGLRLARHRFDSTAYTLTTAVGRHAKNTHILLTLLSVSTMASIICLSSPFVGADTGSSGDEYPNGSSLNWSSSFAKLRKTSPNKRGDGESDFEFEHPGSAQAIRHHVLDSWHN